jgi:uroporphyrinogen decarboxylase
MLAITDQGPLFSGAWRLMGLESFSYALVENPGLVAAVFEKVGELSIKIAETNCQKDWVGALWLGDDSAYGETLMTSPKVFRQYALPYYQRIGEVCRRYGKPLIYQAMDIRQLKRDYGSRMALIGNVDVDLLSRGTPDMVAARTKELLRDIAPGGGYLLGSSNSITYNVPLENYRAMLDTLERFGSYPLSL